MSHIAKIEIEIRDLEALKEACKRLGFNFKTNQKYYAWYGIKVGNDLLPEGLTENDLGKCTHAIQIPSASFEIGVVEKDNSYQLMWDSWIHGGLQKAIGKDAGILKQAYAVESVKREARKKGYRLTEKKMKHGIRLSMSV